MMKTMGIIVLVTCVWFMSGLTYIYFDNNKKGPLNLEPVPSIEWQTENINEFWDRVCTKY